MDLRIVFCFGGGGGRRKEGWRMLREDGGRRKGTIFVIDHTSHFYVRV